TPSIYAPSLHDALPIFLSLDLGVFHRRAHAVSFKEAAMWSVVWVGLALAFLGGFYLFMLARLPHDPRLAAIAGFDPRAAAHRARSEEHTSELQSLAYLV